AARTRSLSSSTTGYVLPERTREAVGTETPARCATTLRVTAMDGGYLAAPAALPAGCGAASVPGDPREHRPARPVTDLRFLSSSGAPSAATPPDAPRGRPGARRSRWLPSRQKPLAPCRRPHSAAAPTARLTRA